MVGKFYDEKRGYKPFSKSKKNISELLATFDNQCCFCNESIDDRSISLDHLIPTNKDSLGLNAWGNIVPSCSICNHKKHSKNWEEYIASLTNLNSTEKNDNIKRIKKYLKDRNYNPNLELKEIANNLYNDVGAVAQTLINLRYKQAEDKINNVFDDNVKL